PQLMAGALAANIAFDLIHGTPALAALFFALVNTVQSVASAWMVSRFLNGRPILATLKAFMGFLGCAAVLGNAVGATIGALTLLAFGLSDSFVQSWKVWWGGNAMAILMLSPFVLTWFSATGERMKPLVESERFPEAMLLIITLIGLTWHLLAMGGGIM